MEALCICSEKEKGKNMDATEQLFFLCAAWRGGVDQLPEGDVQPHLSGLHIYSSTKTNNGRRYAESSIRSSYRYEFVMALLWHPSIG